MHVSSALSSGVAVVVPAFDGGPALLRCLDALCSSSIAPASVILVDNASGDGSIGRALERHPGLLLVEHDANLGFARACNAGIERAGAADLVFVVNQDAVVARDTLERLALFMAGRARAGAVGPRTLSLAPLPGGAPRLLYAGSWRTWLPLRQRVPGIERADPGGAGGAVRVDYLWGHGAMFRREALRQVGGFDEKYFLYYEDLDLCARLAAAGWELWCDRGALMWHDLSDGARAGRSEAWRWRRKVQGMRLFHAGRHAAPAAALLTGLTVLAEARQLLCHGRFSAARHLIGAWLSRAPRDARP